MVEKMSKTPAKSFWLIKSEADCFSIDDLKRESVSPWTGVRNFQARNFMRDSMKIGDLALFYHSNSKYIDNPTGIYGLAKVASSPYGDPSALDAKDEHFDPRSLKLKKQAEKDGNNFVPIWVLVDFKFVKKFNKPISLKHLKMDPVLKDMIVCQKGSRLSIQPVSEKHFNHILSIV